MNYGLRLDTIQEQDFVLGATNQLGGTPLMPDGQWDNYIPVKESQGLNNIETMACTSFGTLNCIEVLERFEYGTNSNYSDRFLAKISGTNKSGNSPQTVAETLRKKGTVKQEYWDFDFNIKTFADFYKEIPQKLYTLALEFCLEYSFGHEYVNSNYDSLMKALTYSPLGFSTYAWIKKEDIYYRPQGMSDNHWVMCYGYKRNYYWKVFDSYDNSHKKIRWDCLPMQAKRYTLHRQVVIESFWQKFIKFLHEYLKLRSSVYGRKGTLLNSNEAHHITLCRPHHPSWINKIMKWLSSILKWQPAMDSPSIPFNHVPDAPILPVEESLLWDTISNIKHSMRVIGDEEGLTWVGKNLLCDICRCESGFKLDARLENNPKSIDRGLFQWNNYWHPEITDEMAYNPEKATRLACKAIKQGKVKAYWNASIHCWNKNGKYNIFIEN